jgi:DNA-directed RNA polymerase subunit L
MFVFEIKFPWYSKIKIKIKIVLELCTKSAINSAFQTQHRQLKSFATRTHHKSGWNPGARDG